MITAVYKYGCGDNGSEDAVGNIAPPRASAVDKSKSFE